MKKQFIKGAGAAVAVCLSVSAPVNTLASWSLVNNIWNYTDDAGVLTKGCWRWIDSNYDGISKCYYFNADGSLMVSGTTPDEYNVNESGAWVKDGSIQYKEGAWASWPNEKGETKWYYQNADGTFVTNGWRLLDGNHDGISEYYYFDITGQMLETTLTPDGKTVNADGKMLDENGNVFSVATPNTKNFGHKSTGNATLGTGLASGGSSGGGGGSSSGGSSRSNYSRRSNTAANTSSGSTNTTSEQKMEGMRPVITTEETNDNSSYYTIADYRYGSAMSDMVSDKEKAAVEKKIKSFVDKYITDEQSDYLKVQLICKYLTKNVSYDCDDDGASTKYKTAYEALCKGKAQCMGYADAFLQMATAIGLDARYVYSDINAYDNSLHVYNLVCAEGNWLIVDPTNAFCWSDQSRLSNDCVLMNESVLDSYGYIKADDVAVMVCYGTPETRFAYDGPNMLHGDEIQTADGNPYIYKEESMRMYLNGLEGDYDVCSEFGEETLYFNGEKTSIEDFVEKLLELKGTNKQIGILWERMTHGDAEKTALKIVALLNNEGCDIKLPFDGYYHEHINYVEFDDYRRYNSCSIWQIIEIDKNTSNEAEEVVAQHEENVENSSNAEEVIEADNPNESDDENRTTSDDAGSDDDKQAKKSNKEENTDMSEEDDVENKLEDKEETSGSVNTEDSDNDNSETNEDSSEEANSDGSSDTNDSLNKNSENSNNEDPGNKDVKSNDDTSNETSGNSSNDSNG